MRYSESELERVIAAARGIPIPPPCLSDAPLERRLTAAAHWLRFWHERAATVSGLRTMTSAGRAADS